MKPSGRSTRRSTTAIQPTEPCEDQLRYRIAFAEYLKSSAESLRGEPSFFTIRGRHRWGLSLHLCIDTTQYSALLLACGLVDITKYTTGATSVSCPLDSWRDFLERYGVADGSKGHCEVTKGMINYSALEGCTISKPRAPPSKNNRIH